MILDRANSPIFSLSVLALCLAVVIGGCEGTTESGEPAPADTSGEPDDVEMFDDVAVAPTDAGAHDIEAPQPDSQPRNDGGVLAGVDMGPVDAGPIDPCAPVADGIHYSVTVPLGETLFFNGDDYLSFWDGPSECKITLEAAPAGAVAKLNVGGRLTPDLAGEWTLRRGPETAVVTIDDAYLTSDTFLNYNYTPVNPLALVSEDLLLVASPASNSVQFVELSATGAVASDEVPVGGWPTSLAVVKGTSLVLVAQTARDSIGFLDVPSRTLVDAVRVGNEPAGIIVEADGIAPPIAAWITLSGEDKVVRLDMQSREVSDVFDVGRDARAMVFDAQAGRLFVASLMSSNEHPQGLLTVPEVPLDSILERDISVIDTANASLLGYVPHVGTMLRGMWLNDSGQLVVGVSHSHNNVAAVDAETRPHRHGLAIVTVAENPADSAVEHIDLDDQESSTGPAASPFSIHPTPAGDELLVTLSAGAQVLALDPETYTELSRVTVGNDPRGLAFAHGRAWTFSWLDNRLFGLELPLSESATHVTVDIGSDPTPLAIKQGQRIFNDATFSKYGAFSCNNCHIDGLTDGLVWDLLVDGNVNTISFRNVAGTNPFLWGGLLPTLFDFSREVLKLVGADASGEQMELLTLYMQSVTAPPNPYAGPGGRLTEQALEGKAVFNGEAGCFGCHSGPLYTNGEAVEGKTPGFITDVPSLIGVYDSAPYGRQGDWVTLPAMVDYAIEFTGADLTETQRDALLAYVQQIPGDALYLNSSRPINEDNHVWYETPIELVFSAVLNADQEPLFGFNRLNGDTVIPVDGEWTLSGRVARFIPAAPLELETSYQVTIEGGLVASLGQALKGGLTLEWQTGGLPAFDVSGKWTATISAPQFGVTVDAEVAFLQSSGGKIAGVLLTAFDEGTLSHMEGVVSGETVVLSSFLLDTVIGEVKVDGGELLLEDTDDDGYADIGAGTVTGLGMSVNMTLVRLSLPDDATP